MLDEWISYPELYKRIYNDYRDTVIDLIINGKEIDRNNLPTIFRETLKDVLDEFTADLYISIYLDDLTEKTEDCNEIVIMYGIEDAVNKFIANSGEPFSIHGCAWDLLNEVIDYSYDNIVNGVCQEFIYEYGSYEELIDYETTHHKMELIV